MMKRTNTTPHKPICRATLRAGTASERLPRRLGKLGLGLSLASVLMSTAACLCTDDEAAWDGDAPMAEAVGSHSAALQATLEDSFVASGNAVSVHSGRVLVGGSNFASMYVRDEVGDLVPQALLPANKKPDDQFGYAADHTMNYAIVGAPQGSPTSRWDKRDTSKMAGPGYVSFFKREKGEWVLTQTIQGDKTDALERGPEDWGHAVGISGSYAIVGAPYESASSESYYDRGQAGILEREDSGTWKAKKLPRPDDLKNGDHFGWSVAIDGDFVLVGARDGNGKRYGGFFSTVQRKARLGSGAVYVYKRDKKGNWLMKQKLSPRQAYDWDSFGQSVAVYDRYALIGGRRKAWIYWRNDNGTWKQKRYYYQEDDYSFGSSVAIRGANALIAGRFETWLLERQDAPDAWSKNILPGSKAVDTGINRSVIFSGNNVRLYQLY
jgi:hypothetical protein